MTECQAKHIDLAAFPTDWADLQAFYTSIMDVGSHGCVSLSDAATWFGIEFDESTGHAHSALADARVTAKLLKQMMDGDYRVSPHAQEVRQRWGDGRATPDAPFQQVPRAERPAAEAEGGGEVGGADNIVVSPVKKEPINYKVWMASSEDLNTRLRKGYRAIGTAAFAHRKTLLVQIGTLHIL